MQKYGIYEWVNDTSDVIYIGSTSKWTLKGLEENHRMWKEKGYGWSYFRQALIDEGQNWTVRWAQEPKECTKRQIEIEEGALIRYVRPFYNKDTDPYKSSVEHNRYEELT